MMLLEARNIILWEEGLRRNGHCLQNVPEFGNLGFFHFIPEYCSGCKCIPSTQNIDTSKMLKNKVIKNIKHFSTSVTIWQFETLFW